MAVLPDDVIRYLDRKFSGEERLTAQQALEAAVMHDGKEPEVRLIRCAAVASMGRLDRLKMEVASLKQDYRDVIVEGEYDVVEGKLVHARNLNQPIDDAV